jgi:hypothetical protein
MMNDQWLRVEGVFSLNTIILGIMGIEGEGRMSNFEQFDTSLRAEAWDLRVGAKQSQGYTPHNVKHLKPARRCALSVRKVFN